MAYSQQYLHKTKRLDPEIMEALADPKRCGFDRRTQAGRRDWLMVQVLRQTGMRCVEVARLTPGNMTDQGPDIMIRFRGKGRRERLAMIRNGLAAQLRKYIKARRIKAGDPVFPALDSHGHATDRPVSTTAIYHVVRKLGRRLGMDDLHPHRLRHSWISESIDAGVPIGQVMTMAGHSNLATTERYYHASPARMAEAYASLPDFMG
jgi:integrase/recombinase XerD